MTHDELSERIIGAAIEVHRELGPGLLESIYEDCLAEELIIGGSRVERQVSLPVHYKGRLLGAVLRVDLWVERKVIVEVKTVEKFHEAHVAQLLTYLKLTDCRLGLLINFSDALLKKGVRRVVNKFVE